jgi:hypothetical protein
MYYFWLGREADEGLSESNDISQGNRPERDDQSYDSMAAAYGYIEADGWMTQWPKL